MKLVEMMDDLNIKSCKFAAEIVPYMYGELGEAESGVFESHLLDCGDCTDEFAAVSNARFEVYDWKKTGFDPLPTPAFVIPDAEPVAAGVSWVEKIRSAFRPQWSVPAFGLATLAVFAVAAASFYLKSDTGHTVAQGNSDTLPTAVSSPDMRTSVVETRMQDTEEREDVVKPVVAKAPLKTMTSNPRSARRTEVRTQPRVTEPKPTTATRAPRLNEFNDDEDTSLRLAQLFDDIDTKD